MIFIIIKDQWGFIKGEQHVAQLWGLSWPTYTTDGEYVLKWIAIAYVVYSTQTRIRLNQGHYINVSDPLSKHAFIEIVNTTKVHRRT